MTQLVKEHVIELGLRNLVCKTRGEHHDRPEDADDRWPYRSSARRHARQSAEPETERRSSRPRGQSVGRVETFQALGAKSAVPPRNHYGAHNCT
jgi:hypothetical protein